MKKTQVIIVSVFGLLVLLVIWTISAMKGKEENQNTVRLSTDNKDVTITDVKAQLERTPLRKQAEGQGGDNPVDIERMRQLIINSEMPPEEEYGRKADTASYILPTHLAEHGARLEGAVFFKKEIHESVALHPLWANE